MAREPHCARAVPGQPDRIAPGPRRRRVGVELDGAGRRVRRRDDLHAGGHLRRRLGPEHAAPEHLHHVRRHRGPVLGELHDGAHHHLGFLRGGEPDEPAVVLPMGVLGGAGLAGDRQIATAGRGRSTPLHHRDERAAKPVELGIREAERARSCPPVAGPRAERARGRHPPARRRTAPCSPVTACSRPARSRSSGSWPEDSTAADRRAGRSRRWRPDRWARSRWAGPRGSCPGNPSARRPREWRRARAAAPPDRSTRHSSRRPRPRGRATRALPSSSSGTPGCPCGARPGMAPACGCPAR